jgi:outer membrane receptor for ferrienterochelin and colicins
MMNAISIRAGLAHTAAALVLAAAAPAAAQSIDHGEFEAIFGEPVTTSATGAPQRASEVPVAMTIITGEDIRRTGAISLAEALRGRAGIDVNHFTAQQYDVAIRGGNQPDNPRVLVMINGRQIYLDQYGMTSWSNLGIELSEIRQIEIVKGPVSALFGFNAASGAINIITYDPVSDRVNSASAQAGNDGARTVSAVATLHFNEKVGIRLSGGYAEQDEFKAIGPLYSDRPYRQNLAVDAGFKPSDTVSARLDYSYARSLQSGVSPGFTALGVMFRTNGVKGEVSGDTDWGLLSATIDYADLLSKYDIVLDGNLNNFHSTRLVGRLQDIVKVGVADTIRITAEIRRAALNEQPDLIGKLSYTVYSGGPMWDHRFSDKIALNLAGRIDYLELKQAGAIDPLFGLNSSDFNQKFTAWSANAGLVIKPDEMSTVRIQAARGVQAPALNSLAGGARVTFAPGVFVDFVGNPGLRPSVTESAELGYSRKIEAIDGKFSANVFYSRSHDLSTVNQRLPRFVSGFGVIIDARFDGGGAFESYGIESTLSGKLGAALTWQLDYTYDQIHNRFSAQPSLQNQPFRALTPRHKVGASVGYSRGPLTIDLRSFVRSDVSFPFDGRKSGWMAGLDGHVGWRLAQHVELFATGENLTEDRFIDNGYIRQSARGRIGVRFDL